MGQRAPDHGVMVNCAALCIRVALNLKAANLSGIIMMPTMSAAHWLSACAYLRGQVNISDGPGGSSAWRPWPR